MKTIGMDNIVFGRDNLDKIEISNMFKLYSVYIVNAGCIALIFIVDSAG